MSIFDISPTRTQEVNEAAARSGNVEFGQTGIEPSWYSFNIDGSAWKSASAAADLAKVEATYQLTDPEYRGPLEAQRQAAIKAAQDAKPDQRFNGALGNVMHTLGEMGYLFAGAGAAGATAGATIGGTAGLVGGPAVALAGATAGTITGGIWGGLIGSNAILATRENILLQESGVSPAAARSVAGITGILGAFAPAGGKVVTPFTTKIASFLGNSFSSKAWAQIVREAAETAVGNIAINATGRGVQSTILEQSGYAEQAKDYHALDATAMLVDGVLGAAFGSGGKALHLRSERAKAAREAAGTDGNDGGPGSPPAGAGDPIPTVHALMDTGGGPLDGLLVTIDPDQGGARQGVSVAVVLPDGTRHITGIRTIDIEAAKGATVHEPKVETVQVDTPTLESEGIQSTQITPSDVDLALALNNAVHNETSNPFGIPTDKDTSIKHHENVAQIESDMYHDTQLTILHDIADGSYIPDPAIAAHQANHDAVITQLSADLGGPEVVGRIIPAIEAAPVAVPVADAGGVLKERVASDFETLKREYDKLPDSQGGRLVSSDVAKELSPEYRANRTLAGVVHDAASAFAKKQYADILAKPVPDGQAAEVLITGGGSGAGKSSGMTLMGKIANEANAIYDTTLADFKSSKDKIEQALAAGRRVVIAYTFRDPVEAFAGGVLPRAMSEGRTVPLETHISSHTGARQTIEKLTKLYENNPDVLFYVVDNSRGKDLAQISSLDKLPITDPIELKKALQNELETAVQTGKISQEVYDATIAGDGSRRNNTGGIRSAGETDSAGNRGQSEQDSRGSARSGLTPEQPKTKSSAESVVPEKGPRVDAILEDRPDLKVSDKDGSATNAPDFLSEAERDILKSVEDGKDIEVAISCELRG